MKLNLGYAPFPQFKKLKGISAVVIRWLSKYYWEFDNVDRNKHLHSPRFLLYLTYRALRKQEHEVKKLTDYIAYLDKRNTNLHARIVDLQGYEKQVLYAGYTATVIHYSWSCGDGCCSDGWDYYSVYDSERNLVKCSSDWPGNRDTCYGSRDHCISEIHEKYGKHVKINYATQYSDRDDEIFND